MSTQKTTIDQQQIAATIQTKQQHQTNNKSTEHNDIGKKQMMTAMKQPQQKTNNDKQ